MAETAMLMVFAYDISSDKLRARIAAKLEEKLSRVQDSVFEGWMTPSSAHALAERLSSALAPEDSLRVYAVPRSALRHSRSYGQLPISEPHDFWLL